MNMHSQFRDKDVSLLCCRGPCISFMAKTELSDCIVCIGFEWQSLWFAVQHESNLFGFIQLKTSLQMSNNCDMRHVFQGLLHQSSAPPPNFNNPCHQTLKSILFSLECGWSKSFPPKYRGVSRAKGLSESGNIWVGFWRAEKKILVTPFRWPWALFSVICHF